MAAFIYSKDSFISFKDRPASSKILTPIFALSRKAPHFTAAIANILNDDEFREGTVWDNRDEFVIVDFGDDYLKGRELVKFFTKVTPGVPDAQRFKILLIPKASVGQNFDEDAHKLIISELEVYKTPIVCKDPTEPAPNLVEDEDRLSYYDYRDIFPSPEFRKSCEASLSTYIKYAKNEIDKLEKSAVYNDDQKAASYLGLHPENSGAFLYAVIMFDFCVSDPERFDRMFAKLLSPLFMVAGEDYFDYDSARHTFVSVPSSKQFAIKFKITVNALKSKLNDFTSQVMAISHKILTVKDLPDLEEEFVSTIMENANQFAKHIKQIVRPHDIYDSYLTEKLSKLGRDSIPPLDSFFSFKNGIDMDILDLDGEAIVRNHTHRRIRCSGVNYLAPEEVDPLKVAAIKNFLLTFCCGDVEKYKYLIRILFSFFVGRNIFRVFFIFIGSGSNGKTIIMNLIKECMHEYYYNANAALVYDNNKSFESHDGDLKNYMWRKIFGFDDNMRESATIDMTKIKQMTGSPIWTQNVRSCGADDPRNRNFTGMMLFSLNSMAKGFDNKTATLDRLRAFEAEARFEDGAALSGGIDLFVERHRQELESIPKLDEKLASILDMGANDGFTPEYIDKIPPEHRLDIIADFYEKNKDNERPNVAISDLHKMTHDEMLAEFPEIIEHMKAYYPEYLLRKKAKRYVMKKDSKLIDLLSTSDYLDHFAHLIILEGREQYREIMKKESSDPQDYFALNELMKDYQEVIIAESSKFEIDVRTWIEEHVEKCTGKQKTNVLICSDEDKVAYGKNGLVDLFNSYYSRKITAPGLATILKKAGFIISDKRLYGIKSASKQKKYDIEGLTLKNSEVSGRGLCICGYRWKVGEIDEKKALFTF